MARWDDHRVQLAVGSLLRYGVLTAALVTGLGGVLYLVGQGGAPVNYGMFRGEPQELSSLAGIIRGAVHLQARALTQLGLVLLIATPVARVALSLLGFVMERDRKYQVITLVVLLILLGSLLGRI
ncbi:MAG TPA: DUF1634 domain-containing protein [Gemmatimonadales bacterium]|nr:DUF1634 domain-containing protein [Gemmatimonadales bacterium]